jgi:hypothetical protein
MLPRLERLNLCLYALMLPALRSPLLAKLLPVLSRLLDLQAVW